MTNQEIIESWKKKKIFQSEHDKYKKKKFLLTSYTKSTMLGYSPKSIYPLLFSDTYNRYYKMKGYNVMNCVGLDDMSFNAVSLIHDRGLDFLTFDDFYIKTLDSIGIGYDLDKVMTSSNSELLNYIDNVFISLYNKDIFYKKRDVFSPILLNKMYNSFDVYKEMDHYYHKATKEEVFLRNDYAFVLNIKKYHEEIRDEINSLNVDDSIKERLHNDLLDYEKIIVPFSNKDLNIELKIELLHPEFIAGASFIAINPSLVDDVFLYVSQEERQSVYKYMENGYQEGVFSGIYVKNPLTYEDLYIFISYDFNEPFHLAIPQINDVDLKYTKAFGLEEKEILENGLLINSDFLTGLTKEEGREVFISNFINEGIGEIKHYYKLDEIIISSKDYYGIPIPIYETDDSIDFKPLDSYYLPVSLNRHLKPQITNEEEFDSSRLVKETFNSYFLTGLLPILLHKIENDPVADKTDLFNEFNEYFIKNDEIESYILMPLIFKIILNERFGMDSYYIFDSLSYDQKEVEDSTKLNINILDELLKSQDSDAIRLTILSNKLYLKLDKEILSSEKYKGFIDCLYLVYKEGFKESGNLLFKLDNLKASLENCLKMHRIDSYIEQIMDFFYHEIQSQKMTKKEGMYYLKLISIVMPFTSQKIYSEIFKENYYIVYEEWE